jgi:hypothetical protein
MFLRRPAGGRQQRLAGAGMKHPYLHILVPRVYTPVSVQPALYTSVHTVRRMRFVTP